MVACVQPDLKFLRPRPITWEMIGLRRRHVERVRVLVPQVATFEATVVRAVSGAAELAIPKAGALSARFLHRRRATIVSLAGDDRLDGTLLAVPGAHGRVREDLLHFLEAVVPLAPPRRAAQRRDAARIDLVRPVALIPEGFRVGWLNGFTRNVSAGGVLVAGAEALGAVARLRLRCELDSDEELIDILPRASATDETWGL